VTFGSEVVEDKSASR